MISHPEWEGGIALAISQLGLKGQRQGVSPRKAALSLPLQHKCEVVRRALEAGLASPSPAEATKLQGLWGLSTPNGITGPTRLSSKQWKLLAAGLQVRISARYGDYKLAQQALYLRHEPLACSCAFAVCRERSKLDDAQQEGRLGLLQAIDRIKPDQQFEAYARLWIERRIRNFLMRERLPVKAPVNLISQSLRSRDCARQDGNALLQQALFAGTLSLDGVAGAVGSEAEAPFLDAADAPDRAAARSDERDLLRRAINELTAKQRQVIGLRFGLADVAATRSLAQIAAQAGISRQQVFQREKRAFQKLAASLRELGVERSPGEGVAGAPRS